MWALPLDPYLCQSKRKLYRSSRKVRSAKKWPIWSNLTVPQRCTKLDWVWLNQSIWTSVHILSTVPGLGKPGHYMFIPAPGLCFSYTLPAQHWTLFSPSAHPLTTRWTNQPPPPTHWSCKLFLEPVLPAFSCTGSWLKQIGVWGGPGGIGLLGEGLFVWMWGTGRAKNIPWLEGREAPLPPNLPCKAISPSTLLSPSHPNLLQSGGLEGSKSFSYPPPPALCRPC